MQTRSTPDTDVVLYGQNDTPGVVAVQQLNESTVRIYRREQGEITQTDAEFFPFFFLASDQLLSGFPRRYWMKELAGANTYRFLVAFPRWHDLWEAIRYVITTYNKSAARRVGHYTELDALLLKADPITQFLLQSGVTLFKGMDFGELHRLQISMQTYCKPHRPSDARKSEDRVLSIALSDNRGWEELLDGRQLTEQEMLQNLVGSVIARNPDAIEGHDLHDQVLPYLAKRAELHGIDLALGRDGSSLHSFSPRGGTAERDLENAVFEVAGRQLIDIRTLAHGYDIAKRSLESHSLRYLASHFGLSAHDRIVVPAERIAATWVEQPELIMRVARQETAEIRSLSGHLLPSSFYLVQMCPLSLGAVIRAGSAAKIELLLLREYIRQKHSVPRPQIGSQTTGGYTDIFLTGLLSHIVHADIESLYPSIMLSREIKPTSDALNIFPTLLRHLTSKRLEAKRAMQNSSSADDRRRLDALQSSLKILINSFYGYLGYARGLFNDYEQADRVTNAGQELLKSIVKQVELHNSQVVEVDTDGLFFIPPDNVKGAEQESILVEKLSSSLPEGIRLVLAGRYNKMLSYKKKNYALLDYNDRLTIKGSSLISRTLERFAKNFIELAVGCLLQEDFIGLHNLYVSFSKDITGHRWEAADFCRTETLKDSIETYEAEVGENRRKPSAAYEVVRRSGLAARPGDRISYYVTGTHAGVKIAENCRLAVEWDPNFPDENTAYYLDRLNECSKKFEVFFEPQDFKKIFSSDDLFGFTSEGIRLIQQKARAEEETPGLDEESTEFGIWIDE